MVLFQNFVQVLEKYAVFEGRAGRREFWWYVLATVVIAFFIGLVVAISLLAAIPYAFYILIYAFILAIFTPTLAVTVRRLHDTGRSAWWSLGFVVSAVYDLAGFLAPLGFDPQLLPVSIALGLYNIMLVVFLALPGNSGENKYGADPQ